MLNLIISNVKKFFVPAALSTKDVADAIGFNDKPQAVVPIQQQKLFETFPFIHYLKGRLIDAIDEETGERWTGHVAMFYRDTGRIRIDWDNGATTYHQLGEDSMWLFKLAKKGDK